MDRNSCQPGRKLGPALKLSQMLVSSHVRILHDIFRFPIVAQDCPCHAIEPLVVAAHQNFIKWRLAGQHATDDFLGHSLRQAAAVLSSTPISNLTNPKDESFREHVSDEAEDSLLENAGRS